MKRAKWVKKVTVALFTVILMTVGFFLIRSYCLHQECLARLRSEFQSHIFDNQTKTFIRTKLKPWGLFNTGKMPSITNSDGESVQLNKEGGLKYSGISQEVFWTFSDPFLEQMIRSNLQFAVEYARINELPMREVLSVVRDSLASSIDQVYGEMQRIDQKLRGDGYPSSVTIQDVREKRDVMYSFLNEQYRVKLQAKSKPSVERFYRENQFLFWLISFVGVSGIIWLIRRMRLIGVKQQ
ncbi:MAG: hypothetical protein WC334_01600 [Kiritimatiellales bacterium]|jgi:hypothetical protein